MATTQKERDARKAGLQEEIRKLLIDKGLVTLQVGGDLRMTEEGVLAVIGLVAFFALGDLDEPATTPLGLAAKQVGRHAFTLLQGTGAV